MVYINITKNLPFKVRFLKKKEKKKVLIYAYIPPQIKWHPKIHANKAQAHYEGVRLRQTSAHIMNVLYKRLLPRSQSSAGQRQLFEVSTVICLFYLNNNCHVLFQKEK